MPKYRIRPNCFHYTRTGSGSGLHQNKAGDIIELTEYKANAIRDKVELVGKTEVEAAVEETEKKEVEKSLPTISENEDGTFNVINAETGEPINDEPLTQKEAEEMAEINELLA